MSKLEIVYQNVNELIPYNKNPRNNKEAVKYVANSIKEFGFKVPIIVDKDNIIVAGHTRLLAAIDLGLDEVPTILADDLSEEQIKAFRLADNKVSEKSKWDDKLLDLELDDIEGLDMSQFGFDLSIDEEDEYEEEGDVDFPEILGEEHNYIVLYFDNEVDWLQAESLFNLKPVQNMSTRKDGVITSGMKSLGLGRVIKGRDAINSILGANDEN